MSAPLRSLVVGSAFRNATPYLTRYFTQVAWLKGAAEPLGYRVRVAAIEGDSTDDTRRQLGHVAGVFGIDCTVHDASHGKRVFASTEEPERMAALSQVGNAILDAVRDDDDVLVYVESDLLWSAGAITGTLFSLLDSAKYDSVSPLVFAGDAFYDIWGFRGLDDQRYSPFVPFHPDLAPPPALTEVSSVGSCLVMGGYLARDERVRMSNGALVEFCTVARSFGYSFAVNPAYRINHP